MANLSSALTGAWLIARRFGRIVLVVALGFDVAHSVQSAIQAARNLMISLDTENAITVFFVVLQIVGFVIWSTDALMHSYRVAKRIVDDEHEKK